MGQTEQPICAVVAFLVIVAVIGWAISNYQIAEKDRLAKANLIKAHDAEITGRINDAHSKVALLRLTAQRENIPDGSLYQEITSVLNGKQANQPTNIYPEFKDRRFASLLMALSGMVPAEEQATITKALSGFRSIEEKSDISQPTTAIKAKQDDERMTNTLNALDTMLDNIAQKRWSGYR